MAAPTRADWMLDGTPVSTEADYQLSPVTLADGTGGMYMVWIDYRSGDGNIYAQRIDAHGNALWTPGGLPVCAVAQSQNEAVVCTDGAGGIIVAWTDYRNVSSSEIYAQRVAPDGTMYWTAGGVPVIDHWATQLSPVIVSDGANGAYVLWRDYRSDPFTADIYLQRLLSNGARLWALDGSAVGTYCGQDDALTAVADGIGGFFAAYVNSCNFYFQAQVIRYQSSSGIVYQTTPYVSYGISHEYQPQLAADGTGGAFITWVSTRAGSADIFAQRHSSTTGARLWSPDGHAVCVEGDTQSDPRIISDGAGGALIAWSDFRSGTNYDIYAQRMAPGGNRLWPLAGVALCTEPSSQYLTSVVPNGAGGAAAVWVDYRSGDADVYAQSVGVMGVALWTPDGVPMSAGPGPQYEPRAVQSGTGVMAAWYDVRSGDYDIYAQRIELSYGTWGHPEPHVVSVADNPSDQGGRVIVKWDASGRDALHHRTITHYSVWRAADASAAAAAFNVSIGQGPLLSNDYWELVGTQDAAYTDRYSFAMSTRQDSVAGDPALHHVRVLAHTADPFVFYVSDIDSGYSVDNLAPDAPLMLAALRLSITEVRLRWRHSPATDLRQYAVYRANASGVQPTPIHFMTSATDTVLIDHNAPTGSSYFYIVTAQDLHGNQSTPSNEASVSGSTGAGDTPDLRVLTLLPAYPNPATGPVSLRVGLPEAGRVDVEVFDVAGRRVGAVSRAAAAGWHEIPFDTRDQNATPLPSGVYFYRVRAAGMVETGRFVVKR